MNTQADMNMRMDLFRYYIHGIKELISGDDFSPLSLKKFQSVDVGNGSFKNKEHGKEENGAMGYGSLFSNAAGNGLSVHGKERLLAMLRKSVVELNAEVDEMMDPVLSTVQLRGLLASETNSASYEDANGNTESDMHARKRHKANGPLTASPASCNLTEEGSLGERKGVVELDKCKSLRRCNNPGCGSYARKTNLEIKSLCGDCSKQGMNDSLLGSSSRDDKGNGEVNDVLQVLLVNKGPKVMAKLEKHSVELFVALERMKEKLEELVDIVVSSCRAMTLAEKQHLRTLIQNLHPKNLERIAGILQRGKPPEKQAKDDDMTIDLQNEDNSTLWRIYFHVKAVENGRKLL